ncbi:MAG: hypothetical protein V1844_23640 [Pseudomonadota bacterium]
MVIIITGDGDEAFCAGFDMHPENFINNAKDQFNAPACPVRGNAYGARRCWKDFGLNGILV